MGHLSSTMQRVATEEEATAGKDDGWKPAGEPLLDQPSRDARSSTPDDTDEMQQRISAPAAYLPSIGQIVVFHLRSGDARNRRAKFPAIVMDDPEPDGRLRLWVIVDDGDTWMQEHVLPRCAPEAGWELVEAPVRDQRIATLEAEVRDLERGIELLGQGAGVPEELMARVAKLEKAISAKSADAAQTSRLATKPKKPVTQSPVVGAKPKTPSS